MRVDDHQRWDQKAEDVSNVSRRGPEGDLHPILLIGEVIVDDDQRDGPAVHLEESKHHHEYKREGNGVARCDDVGDREKREESIGQGEGDARDHEVADHGLLVHREVASEEADAHGEVDAEVQEGEEDVGELELRLEEGLAVGVARSEGVHQHVRQEGQDIGSVLHLLSYWE